MKQKSTIGILILIVLLIFTISYNIKVTTKLERYEDYMSERIGNLVRPAACDIIESKEVLKEIAASGKINQIQYIELRTANSNFNKNLSELRQFANKVISKDEKYDLTPIYLNFWRFLEEIKFNAEFSDIDLDYENPKEKILTDEELRKFKIMERIINDYSNIFIEGLNDYRTGKLENSHHLYDIEYNVRSERWILVLEEICKYNFNSQYKDEF